MYPCLGIDIGTTFITIYDNRSSSVSRIRHEGRIIDSVRKIIHDFDQNTMCTFTGKAGKEIASLLEGTYIEETIALSSLLSSFDRNWSNRKDSKEKKCQIIDIGASSLTLYTLKDNKIVDITQNTLCASGTGLFLEEQAERLNIDLEKQGILSITDPPMIASRCTVFAKSDLIHHQQEGRSKDQMWSGLCRSLVISAVNTLFRGEDPSGKILVCGGVSLNKEVLRWFEKLYPEVEWILPENSEALIAYGASLLDGTRIESLNRNTERKGKYFKRMPALTLLKSDYPEMSPPVMDRFDNEIRIHNDYRNTREIILGMDIGSTSTKLAVLDSQTGEPLLDIYGRTAGDPVGAAKKIFSSFYQHIGEGDFIIKAFGTTGSGRKLVGKIFGADHIVNEITAHGMGAVHFFPDVETIFEIGGQDAKYIRLTDGYVADVNMNYVCAAGTGSFVEEQARKLGFKVHEIGEITEGIAPPVTSDRCTVFMEQDLRMLLKEGFSKEEALASVLYSVIQNYLNRVVGNRPVSSTKIFFQGATARNKGLVAALENLLGVQVIVSPFCHLMGAIGAALMARNFVSERQIKSFGKSRNLFSKRFLVAEGKSIEPPYSSFIGKDAIDIEVQSRTEVCHLCRNFCRINYISRIAHHSHEEHDEFSWGYQCGRDPEDKTRKEIRGYQLFRDREKAFYIKNELPRDTAKKGDITLIHTLTNYTFHPFWVRFFNLLGYHVSLSGLTDSKIKKYSSKIASADFCFPVKVTLGHIIKALEVPHPHFIFFPYMIADKTELKTANSYYCPYVESSPSIVRSTLSRNGIPADNLLTPVIDFRLPDRETANGIFDALKDRLDVKKKDVLQAFTQAYHYWKALFHSLEQKGTELFDKLKNTGEPVFLLVGRPYNMHDRGLNLGIPEKIASMGFPVVPIDMIELDTASLSLNNYHNVFWKYGQRVMTALQLAGQYRNVFPIYLSNFNCGPDSFLLNFAEEELKGKPILILELDEHDSDGGYLTRIEAFIDVVNAYMRKAEHPRKNSIPPVFTPDRSPDLNGTIWMSPIHYSGYRFYSAAFRGFGYDCRSLDLEDHEALLIGKKHLRGGECLPMTLTLGNFLKHVQNVNHGGRHILFMPTTEGPCRFGQYNLLERIVFHRLGLDNVDILSPSSLNSYQGLPEKLRRQLMHATIGSDVLFKMRSKVRPYELTRGDSDALFEKSMKRMEILLEQKDQPLRIIEEIASQFKAIPVRKEQRPLVGIVGEIYVRCNSFSNRNLVEVIEANGGEAWLSPIHEWILYVVHMQRFAARKMNEGFLKRSEYMINNLYIYRTEQSYYKAASKLLYDREEPHISEVVKAGADYFPQEFEGEAILTVGRSVLFARQGVSMVVNASPFGCMPGTLSSAILLEIKEKFEIPFLSLFYDGDLDVNDKVRLLLKSIT